MAESDPENMRAIRETLASFAGQPMFLAGSYVFLRTSESFLFDRRAGGYQCRGFRSELIVTAHCSWKIVRGGVILVRSWQPSNGRRYRSWRSWIPRRSRLLERFFDGEGKGTGDAEALTVSGVDLSDAHELRFRFRGGCELIFTLNEKREEAWAINHDGGLGIECYRGRYRISYLEE